MAERIQWMNYKGKRILYIDYKGLTREEGRATLQKAAKIIKETPTKVAVLQDMRDYTLDSDFMSEAKVLAQDLKEHFSKHAILGITGAKKVLFRAVVFFTGADVVSFAAEEEAKEYLIS